MFRSVKNHRFAKPAPRRRAFGFDPLESRALLASTVFSAPDVSTLASAAQAGQNTAPATIKVMLNALQTQLTSGPVADLQAGTVDNAGFATEVTALLASFDTGVDTALLPTYPNVDAIIKLSGTKVGADLTNVGQQLTVGLIDSTTAATNVQTAINGLTSGPLKPLGTSVAALKSTTATLETNLNTLAQTLGTGATTPLTSAQVAATTNTEVEAYAADLNASLYGRTPITNAVASSVSTLETQAAAIAGGTSTGTGTDQAQFEAAYSTFESSLPSILQPKKS